MSFYRNHVYPQLAQAVIPAGTVPGVYYILAVADYPKVIVESNESNNANGFAITVP